MFVYLPSRDDGWLMERMINVVLKLANIAYVVGVLSKFINRSNISLENT